MGGAYAQMQEQLRGRTAHAAGAPPGRIFPAQRCPLGVQGDSTVGTTGAMADNDADRTNEQTEEQQGTFDTERGRSKDQPMNDSQRRYLEPLADSQDEQVNEDMTEAQAAATIDRLQENAASIYGSRSPRD